MLKLSSASHRLVLAILIAVALSLGLNAILNRRANGEDMLPTSPRIAELFMKTKTICIGRFLIDVPHQAQVVYGPAYVPWPLTTYLGKGAKIDEIIAERLVQIKDEKLFASGELRSRESYVGEVISGTKPGQKIVFGVSKGSSHIYRIDSYIKLNDDLFIQQADPIPEEKDAAVRELNATASSLHPRGELEVPIEPGVCIEGGFVNYPTTSEYEIVNLGIRLAEFPDVHFSLSATKKDVWVESDALEPRLKQAEKIANRSENAAWYSRIKTLRRGQREIGKWRGYEMLARKPAQDQEGESHEFVFVSQGEPKNALLPVLELELHTGVNANQIGGAKPSVNDDEAVAIWDKLTASIRIRPTNAK